MQLQVPVEYLPVAVTVTFPNRLYKTGLVSTIGTQLDQFGRESDNTNTPANTTILQAESRL